MSISKAKKVCLSVIIPIAVAFTVLISVLFFPYIKAEFLTLSHGDEFAELYEQIGWLTGIEYFKVIEYSADAATVVYIEGGHNTCFRVEFVAEGDSWRAESFDCVWSTSGSADSFMWPYYR